MNETWMQHGLCGHAVSRGDAKADWWHPPHKNLPETVSAIEYCNVCPVKKRCSDFGEVSGFSGIWGGKIKGARRKGF